VIGFHLSTVRNRIYTLFLEQPDQFVPDRFKVSELSLSHHKTLSPENDREVKTVAYDSFVDDRFHRDINFGKALASQRFANWIDDICNEKESLFHILRLRDEVVGFGAFRGSTFSLMGLSRCYANSGLGDYLMLSCLKGMSELEYSTVKSVISVNNVPMVNCVSRVGGKFKHPMTTFHYWSSL
jgi:hypothetical protein